MIDADPLLRGTEERDHNATLATLSNAEKEAVWTYRGAKERGEDWTNSGERIYLEAWRKGRLALLADWPAWAKGTPEALIEAIGELLFGMHYDADSEKHLPGGCSSEYETALWRVWALANPNGQEVRPAEPAAAQWVALRQAAEDARHELVSLAGALFPLSGGGRPLRAMTDGVIARLDAALAGDVK